MSSRVGTRFGIARAVLGLVLLAASTNALPQQCAAPAAKLVSIQGSVELRQVGAQLWRAAQSDIQLCSGDSVRIGPRSRAALLLPNETTLRLDQGTTLTLAAPDSAQGSLLELMRGAIHVISRTPKPFRINTPFLNAGVEGTEFLVGSSEARASVAVFEGRVTASTAEASLMLVGGEIAYAGKDAPLRKERLLRPADAVQWALYYPTILDYRLGEGLAGTPGEAALRESIALYRQDRLAEAIFRLEGVPEGSSSPKLLTYRAGLLLLVGRADEAGPDLDRALRLDPNDSNAHALQSIVAVVQNDKDSALKLATKAVEQDQKSPVARIALSYAQQAHFKIEEALATVEKAVELDPQNALAWARLAELHMSTGYLDRALEAARRAVSLNLNLAKTQSVLGFAHLTRIDTKAAKEAFQRAIELDQADPLSRLGLGLAMIREGDLSVGREQIEIAVCLDPENSLLRSYVGKAYYEEKRDKLAGIQFDLAKERDPRDPTPWFYSAIRKQTENRPVDALRDLEKSIELNDNRAVYRSRLLLDQDLAARNASLARIHGDLGFDRLSLLDATQSIAVAPGDYSAHRFLAGAYATLPRHEIAQVSELLQSQLRQPLSIGPVEPFLADDRNFPADDRNRALKTGSVRGLDFTRPGLNEYSRLFERDGTSLSAEAIVGSRGTFRDQLTLSGIRDGISFSLGQTHFESDGLKSGTAQRRDVSNAFLQANISNALSVQGELRFLDARRDEVYFPFDPNWSLKVTLRQRVFNARVGTRYAWSPTSDLIFSAIWQTRDVDESFVDFPETRTLESRGLTAELQANHAVGAFAITAGAGRFDGRNNFVAFGFANDVIHDNAYLYGRYGGSLQPLQIQFGVSTESLSIDGVRRQYTNPKLGVVAQVTPNTVLRAAAFKSVKRQLIGKQTIEPTQIAGFNQFFDDPDGSEARRVGLALDHRFGRDLYCGFELAKRELDVPFVGGDERFKWRERTSRAYLYWLISPGWRQGPLGSWGLAVSADSEWERLERDEWFTGLEGIRNLRTWIVPLGLRLFHPQGLSFSLTQSLIDQKGELQVIPFSNTFATRDLFWITDVTLSYKLPRRKGTATIGVKNLFDRRTNFVDTDSVSPRFAAARFVFARVLLTF